MSTQAFIQKPSKVSRAHDRLHDAIGRLEAALADQPSDIGGAPSPQETTQLNLLEEEIKRLNEENTTLKKVNEQVSTRLDAAIKRLKSMIGD